MKEGIRQIYTAYYLVNNSFKEVLTPAKSESKPVFTKATVHLLYLLHF